MTDSDNIHSASQDAKTSSQEETSREGLPEVSPDTVEESEGLEMDNIVPTAGYSMTPIVGLGGSAGSIQALCEFFKLMAPDSGLVFVVVLHLSPEHESTLAAIFQRETSMPVVQVKDGVKVEANTVYVIPPGKHLASTNGHLRLTALQSDKGKRVAVDIFFRTLADSHGAHSAAIVFSGGDGDGAVGLKRIKERGGLTVAQDPGEAEHPSMPRTAIDTGMVDWVLKVREMPNRILQYMRGEKNLRLPPEEGSLNLHVEQPKGDEAETALREILAFVRIRTGRDFSNYKRATILRRISRRLQVNALQDLPEYLAFLRTHVGEIAALQQDLLISVTNFFRDREAFKSLAGYIPELFRGKGPGDPLRIWCAGCATGDEAYSLAMLLFEHAHNLDSPPPIQVFATDLNEEAVQIAREGIYPGAIAADVSEERLRRFFSKEHRGYRVRRELREAVLFAPHDVLKDPPFSRVDLVSCRNFLIYLNRDAQKSALDIFHFALLQSGLLFLGSSESAEEMDEFFAPLEKKHRIYRRRNVPHPRLPIATGAGTLVRSLLEKEKFSERPSIPPPVPNAVATDTPAFFSSPEIEGRGWGEMHLRIFSSAGPASLLINGQNEIVHLSGKAGMYLQLGSGELTRNLMLMAHPMLRIELRAALYRAKESQKGSEVLDVPIEINGQPQAVDIHVYPAGEIAPDYQLIVFTSRPGSSQNSTVTEAEPIVRQLERELEGMKANLREMVEQHEVGTEEQKASNEELQAMNEELRSATEELETGREELQSINEELTTVNHELKGKVDELANANSDLHNLMNAAAIATVFLDRDLRITRYTPPAVDLFNLIPTDIGRPLSDLKHRLDYPDLEKDAKGVLKDLVPAVREVGKVGPGWFLARLLPYRTLDDHIGGVVLTFVDISERREAEQASTLQSALINLSFEPIFSWELNDGIVDWNKGCTQLYGYSKEEALGQHSDDLLKTRGPISRQERRAIIQKNGQWTGELEHVAKDGTTLILESRQQLIMADGRKMVLESNRDITGRRESDAALLESQKALLKSDEILRSLVESAREYAIFTTDLDLKVTTWNAGAERLLGYTENEILGKSAKIIFTEEDRSSGQPEVEKNGAMTEGRASDERWHLRKDGSRFWSSGFLMAMRDVDQNPFGYVKILRDATEERRALQEQEMNRDHLKAALDETERARADSVASGQAKDHFIAVLSHELRTPLTPVLFTAGALVQRKDLPPDVIENLELIRRNVQTEASFIDDLLDVTRISSGKLEIVTVPVDLHEIIRSALEVCREDMQARRQTVEVDLTAPKSQVRGDSARLQQVFWNLLKNASKFTPEEGSIRVHSHQGEDNGIVVEIVDSGIGIDPEIRERIFEPFEQGTHSITRRYGGLGLGLAISKAIMEAHGGTITASSSGIGQGATFALRLSQKSLAD